MDEKGVGRGPDSVLQTVTYGGKGGRIYSSVMCYVKKNVCRTISLLDKFFSLE